MNVFAGPSLSLLVAFSHSGDGSFCANSAFITSRRLGIMPDRRFFFIAGAHWGQAPLCPFCIFYFIYLEAKDIFAIFANKKSGTGSTSPIILILLLVKYYPMC